MPLCLEAVECFGTNPIFFQSSFVFARQCEAHSTDVMRLTVCYVFYSCFLSTIYHLHNPNQPTQFCFIYGTVCVFDTCPLTATFLWSAVFMPTYIFSHLLGVFVCRYVCTAFSCVYFCQCIAQLIVLISTSLWIVYHTIDVSLFVPRLKLFALGSLVLVVALAAIHIGASRNSGRPPT